MLNVSKTWLFLALIVVALSGQKSFAEFNSNFSNIGVQVGGIGVSVASGSTTSYPYYGGGYATQYPSYGYGGYGGYSSYPAYGGGCGVCGSHGYVVVPVRPVYAPPCMTGGCMGGGYYPYPVNSSFSSVRVAIGGGGFLRGGRRPVFRPVMRRPVKRAVRRPMPMYMPMY